MNKAMVRLAIAALLCSSFDAAAQNEAMKPKPTEAQQSQEIKVKTELMEVRAVVTDRNGRMIENLKKEDFELLENDQPQEISFFSVSQVVSEKSQPAATEGAVEDKTAKPKGVREQLSEAPVRTTLIYVDNLHLSFSSLNWVKQAIRRFIKERLTDQDVVAVATSGQSLGIAQQFTRDRQLLNYAIEQIRLGPLKREKLFTPELAVSFLADRLDAIRLATSIEAREYSTDCCDVLVSQARGHALQVLTEATFSRTAMLSILKGFAEQMMGLPGKRMIVVFSDGFTLRSNDGDVDNSEVQRAIDRAVRSGVVIYSIDAKGLQSLPTIDASVRMPNYPANKWPSFEIMMQYCDAMEAQAKEDPSFVVDQECHPCHNRPDPRCHFAPDPGQWSYYLNASEREELNGMHSLAVETGGKMYTDTNDLGEALGQAFDANRYYYVLSFYLRPGGDDRKFRSIKVRVRNHPEYTVQHPRGFLPFDTIAKPETDVAKTPQQRLIQAMNAPLPETDVGVSAQAEFMETETDDKQVSLIVYFDGDRIQYRQQDQRNVVGLEILYLINDIMGKQVEGISANVEGSLTPERLTQAKTSGYRFSRRLALKPGVYQVRIGVREEGSDRMGTATAWVEVPELKADKLEMSSLLLRNPLDTDPTVKEGIDVSQLEQVRMVRGIPLYTREDFCEYSFRVHQDAPTSAETELVWMSELLKGDKLIKQEPWVPISAEEKILDSKGWFDIDGEVDLSGFDPGVYEIRVSIKNALSNQTAQRSAVISVE